MQKMARFTDSEIEKLKKSIPLVALLQKQGFDLKKHGKDYVCCCPFHDDKTPSLVVTPSKNLWNCLGACGIGGDNIQWMMQLEQIGFRKAVEMLMEETPHLAAKSVEPVKSKPTQSVTPKSELDHQELLHRVVAHYQERLQTSQPALDYLKKRGLNNDELINHFKIGFCDRKINQILSSRPSVRGKAERLALKETGIVLDSGIERMNGSIVVPVINHNQVLEMYGRKINDIKLRKGAVKHLYLPGKHAGVWNLEGIIDQQEIILCESLIDAMTCWANGFKNVTTSYGINGFTDELLTVIHSTKIEKVLIAYDRDEAGDKASNELIKKLADDPILAVRLKLPPKTDLNEWACRTDNFKDEFKDCLLSALSSFLSRDGLYSGVPGGSTSVAANVEVVENKVESESKKINPQIEAKLNGGDITIELGNRCYRIRGLDKNKSHEVLKINLMIKEGDLFFIDALDLYQAKPRNQFIKQASIECALEERVIKSDLGKILLKLEAVQEEKCQASSDEKVVTLTEEETELALELLKDKNLLQRILTDFNACGVVGEEINKLVGYLAGVSRKLNKPLAIMVQSSSAAGKSSLMDAVLNFMPEEERVQYSAMTGQSLYYLGETDLKNKILAISEEEGISQASYALKLLQSEGEVSIASTGKNATTGDLETQTYHVKGPVMLFLTTTAIDVDEELKNRCVVLAVDEDREQTAAIHEQQRFDETLDGAFADETKDELIGLQRNAQRLLKPLRVINPFATGLTFMNEKTRTRRDHKKYLTLIRSIALLHQYQRSIKIEKRQNKTLEYIEVELSDIEIANRLANEVLGRTLDELPPQTRKMLIELQTMISQACQQKKLEQCDYRFSRRDLREQLGWSYDQVRVHLERLIELEYVLTHRGRRGQSFEYELLYDGKGQDGENFMMGLIDVEDLKKRITSKTSLGGKNTNNGVPLGGHWGAIGGSLGSKKNGTKPACDKSLSLLTGDQLIKSTSRAKSYSNHPSVSI